MEIYDRRHNLQRTSITAFLCVSLLVLACSLLVGYNLQLQKKMLEASSVSYELRILLDRSSNEASLMFKSDNVSYLSDRILLNVRDDFIKTTKEITKKNKRLHTLLLNKQSNIGSLTRTIDMQKIAIELENIDRIWAQFQPRVDEIAGYNIAILRSGNRYWQARDALIAYDSTLFKGVSNVNHLVYQSSLYQNQRLRVLYAMIFALVLVGMWLIWYFTLRPLAERLASNYREIMDKNKHLKYQANHDSLTGLRNRNAFNSKIRSVENRKESISCCCLVLIDLDQFKTINDTLGHDVGDQILIKVARDIKHLPLMGESAYRLGGDEFALFIDKKFNIEIMSQRLDLLLSRIRKPMINNEKEIHCTCSIGIAWGEEQGCRTLEALFKGADTALYQVKRSGRDGYCFYNEACPNHDSALSV